MSSTASGIDDFESSLNILEHEDPLAPLKRDDPLNLRRLLPKDSTVGDCEFQGYKAKCINILLVGRSQSGKTTVLRTLLNPYHGTASTGFADTKEASIHHLVILNKTTNEVIQLNVLDTPGLKEIAKADMTSRPDSQLMELAARCAVQNIVRLNAVCFVGQVGKLNAIDLEAFNMVKNYLGDEFSAISMVIQTHCDEFHPDQIAEFERDFKNHPTSKSFAEYCKLGMFRYGAVDVKKLRAMSDAVQKAIVEEKLQRNAKMRSELLQALISCEKRQIGIKGLEEIIKKSSDQQKKDIRNEFIGKSTPSNENRTGCSIQ